MREVVLTKDGSHTVALAGKSVFYHSLHGAIQESVHVYIQAGWQHVAKGCTQSEILILEMGFGTGLNAFLTAIDAGEIKQRVHYLAVEKDPLTTAEVALLNYPATLGHPALFGSLHQCEWNKATALTPYFTLEKINTDLSLFTTSHRFNLIYYDAFAPSAQPELWTKEVFEKLLSMLQPNGVLVTYCAKGNVRRALLAAGFTVERLAGPKWKREMLRATKT